MSRTPDVRGAHHAQQAAIPDEDLIETDTTEGGNIPPGSSCQNYRPAANPLHELDFLLDVIDLSDGTL